jgi:hypothetical protein
MGIKLFKTIGPLSPEVRFIYTFCILDFITGTIITLYNFSTYNFPLINLLELLFINGEILLLPAYISTVINKKHNWKIPIFLCIIPPIISYYLFESVTIISQAISGIFISYYCISYLNWIFTTKKIFSLSRSNHFWIILGIMICYTASIPSCISILLLFSAGSTNLDFAFADFLINFYLFLNIIMHSFFNKAFTCNKEQQSYYLFQ